MDRAAHDRRDAIVRRSSRDGAADQVRRVRSVKRWMDIDITFDDEGRLVIADTPTERQGAFEAHDAAIAMEARGHVLSDGQSWGRRWLNTFRNIRSSSENPEVLVAYIVARRREAGLPELPEDGEAA